MLYEHSRAGQWPVESEKERTLQQEMIEKNKI